MKVAISAKSCVEVILHPLWVFKYPNPKKINIEKRLVLSIVVSIRQSTGGECTHYVKYFSDAAITSDAGSANGRGEMRSQMLT
jgi:hypothetical protein